MKSISLFRSSTTTEEQSCPTKRWGDNKSKTLINIQNLTESEGYKLSVQI